MIRTISGVVVSTTDFKENSKILNILCSEGVVGIVSKGCKKIKSPLRIISNKLVYANFEIIDNNSHMPILKEGNVIDDFYEIKSDLDKISYYTYITELVAQVMKQNNNPEIFDLYLQSVYKINEGLNPKVIMNILEIKLLDYLGVGINLNSCILCGSKKGIVTIDADLGGYICENCYTNQIIYDEKVQKMLRMYYLVDIKTIKNLDIKEYVIEAINKFLSVYYDRYTGLYIHSKKFLDKKIDI